jgi:ribonuclease P protein component
VPVWQLLTAKKCWPVVVQKVVSAFALQFNCIALRNWSSVRQRADFLKLQHSGQKWVTPAFVIQILRCAEKTPGTEIGFTATKKIGSAVIRNRCKRRLRAACDEVINGFQTKGMQLVLIARSDVLTRDFSLLSKDLRWALRKLGVEKADEHASH